VPRPAPEGRGHCGGRRPAIALLIASWCLAAPAPSLAFDGVLSLGAEGAYAQLDRRAGGDPAVASGGEIGARLAYGLTDSWGAAISWGWSWYGSYSPLVLAESENEEGETVVEETYPYEVEDLRIHNLALSVIYAFDISMLVPYFAVGVSSVRIAETRAGEEDVGWEVGLRLEGGLDIKPVDHLAISALFRSDLYLTEGSPYASQTSFLARISVEWYVGSLGRRGAKR